MVNIKSSMALQQILVEGIGGIGGIVSAGLIRNGYEVTLITENPTITSTINESGISIISDDDKDNVEATAYTSLDNIPEGETFDLALLIMKAGSVKSAAASTISYLEPEGYMVTFQNGIVEYNLIDKYGNDRIIAATVGFGGTMHEPGVYEKTSPGGFHIGQLGDQNMEVLSNLKVILDNIADTEISENMEGVLWSKLAINCTINTLGAITGQRLGTMLSDKQIREIFLDIYQEVVDVASAKGVTLEPIATDPYRLYRSKDAGWLKRFYKDIIVRIVGKKYKNLKSSTLQSLERGRKSEIDVLNGFVVDQAVDLDVSVPVNKAITDVMKQIDSSELEISPNNIEKVKTRIEMYRQN